MELGKNIAKYRKEKHLTQAALAGMLGVSFQAVSKWENSYSMPDIQLLPQLASVLNVSCDILLEHYPAVFSSPYEELYQSSEYYWGTQPTELSMKVLSLYPPQNAPSVLDIGCREGQNVLFFGRNGYRTTGVDISDTGIKKAQRLACKWHVQAELVCASIENYTPSQNFDIVFCENLLHLITPASRLRLLKLCKELTTPGGIHIISVPVEKPFLAASTAWQSYPWYSGDLFSIYKDWEILEGSETAPLTECPSRSPVKRIYNYIAARKPAPLTHPHRQ